MVSVCTGLLGEEGPVSTSVDTRSTINRIPLALPLFIKDKVCQLSISCDFIWEGFLC